MPLTGLSPSLAGFPKTFPLCCSFLPTPPRLNASAALQPRLYRRFGLLQFRSPLLSESLLFSFPGVLRWFSSPSFASAPYLFRCRMPNSRSAGYPIRLSADQWMFAPPRSFSQLTTAFFASIRQGIHRKPLFRLTILLFVQGFSTLTGLCPQTPP